jgi:hypothetical protein
MISRRKTAININIFFFVKENKTATSLKILSFGLSIAMMKHNFFIIDIIVMMKNNFFIIDIIC